MVNTAFATEFKTPCKLGCKCGTVKPVYNGPVDSGHPVYYAHWTTFQFPLYFLKSWPVYSGHPVYNDHLAIFQGWPLYTGFTVYHLCLKLLQLSVAGYFCL